MIKPKRRQDSENISLARAADGAQGLQGNPGQAATIQVGEVTTGEPGSKAQVTNSGSESAAVFDFVIPRGEPGPKGDTGAAGEQERLDPQVPQDPRESLEQAYLMEALPVRSLQNEVTVIKIRIGLILRPAEGAASLVRRLRFRSVKSLLGSRGLKLR